MKNNFIKNILNGELVIFPTDTVYALGCIPNKEAIDKIYKIKRRNKNKKIIALISSINDIKKITDENIDFNLINTFMPGPLTIVCKANKKYKELVGDTIGFRIPNSKIALDIISNVGGVLMTTSANISGEVSVTKLEDVSKEILTKVDNVFESNESLSGIPSTIISYIDNKYSLLREGQIKFEDILNRR